jgi:hypothetical protein
VLNERSLNGGIDEIPLPCPTGRLWLCGKHFVGPDPERALQSVNATTLVCLTESHELIDRYPTYVSWLRAEIRPVKDASPRAVWFPIHDLAARPLLEALPFLNDLVHRIRHNESLIVHCAAGIGRSGTIATSILMLLGTGAEESLRIVAASRPMAGPEVGSQKAFISQLRSSLRGAEDLE